MTDLVKDAARIVQVDDNDWPEPDALRAPAPPPSPYPVDSLGSVLGPAVRALHETIKAPVELCAQSVLASASYAVQAHFDVALPYGQIRPLTLFQLTVGVSGERKSSVDEAVLRTLRTYEMRALEDYGQDMKRYKFDVARYKSDKDKNPDEEPAKPVCQIRFVTDPTVEGLYKLFLDGQPNVALFSDEGGLLLGGHALNNDNALKTLSRWSALWDGAPYDRARGGDGFGKLYGRRLAFHQLAQPVVIKDFLSDPTANGQGFLSRCLVSFPQSTIGSRLIDRFEDPHERPELIQIHERLRELIEMHPVFVDETAQVLKPYALKLDAEATELAVTAHNEIERCMAAGGDLENLRDRGSKALENACRIAGVLTVIEADDIRSLQYIRAGALRRGYYLMNWYLDEALRIRNELLVPQRVDDAELLLNWLKENKVEVFCSTRILQFGPSQLREKSRFDRAASELTKTGHLRENEPGTMVEGVETKRSWRLHPGCLQGQGYQC